MKCVPRKRRCLPTSPHGVTYSTVAGGHFRPTNVDELCSRRGSIPPSLPHTRTSAAIHPILFFFSSQPFVSLYLIFSSHQTDYGHLLLFPIHVCLSFFFFSAFGLASMKLPPAILHVRLCSESFGHVRVACLPHAMSPAVVSAAI